MDLLVPNEVVMFISKLQNDTKAKVARHLDLLAKYNYSLRMPYSKKLINNVFELRIKGRQEIRLMYVFHNNKILVLNGFVKKTNKIPKTEIEKTINRIKALDT